MLRAEVYKEPRPHEIDLCRPGDLAEIVRSHCKPETALLVQVVGEPHWCFNFCRDCGQEVTGWFVEITVAKSLYPAWHDMPGPWFMPIKWLKRVDPRDPVHYERVTHYRPLMPTPEQEKSWNPGMTPEPNVRVIELS